MGSLILISDINFNSILTAVPIKEGTISVKLFLEIFSSVDTLSKIFDVYPSAHIFTFGFFHIHLFYTFGLCLFIS